ncbi:hypothetical protein IJV79_02205 [bacterium]|nr:hypothetical protein [bacterium]
MKVQSIHQYEPSNKISKKQNQSFGAGISPALNFLQTNQAIGATAVDMGFMCTPRTIVDFTRSPQAGVETMRREYSSSLNDAFLGMYGMGAAALLAKGLNKKFDVNAHKLFIDNNRLDILADIKSKTGDLNKDANLKKYLGEIVDSTTAFNPLDTAKADANGWVKIGDKTKTTLVDKLAEEINADATAKGAKKKTNDLKKVLKSILIEDTGAEADFKISRKILDSKENWVQKSSTSSVDDYIDNIIKTSKMFQSQKVHDTFKQGQSVLDNSFVKGLKGLNAKTTIAGIGFCAALGALVQPINIWLTKKQTGSTAFVGGGEENKTAGFKALKAGLAGVGMVGVLRSIGNFKDVFSKIQFKGPLPTIPQFKLVYGITIASRFLSARNENELRESVIKDTLGFANWLILGGFVSKLAALGLEKGAAKKGNPITLLKYNKQEAKGAPKWLAGQVLSREEVLRSALAKAGKSTIKADGKAMNLSELMKLAKQHTPKALKSAKLLNLVQVAGYIYSGLALGIGVPKLNIAITNAINAKKANQQAEKA